MRIFPLQTTFAQAEIGSTKFRTRFYSLTCSRVVHHIYMVCKIVCWSDEYAHKRGVERCLRTGPVNSILPSAIFRSRSASLRGFPAPRYASDRCKHYAGTSRASLVGLGRRHQDVLLYYVMSSDTRRRDLGEDADAIFAGSYIIYSPSRRRRRPESVSGLNDRVRSIFGRSPARVQPFFAGTLREKPTTHSRTMVDARVFIWSRLADPFTSPANGIASDFSCHRPPSPHPSPNHVISARH